MSEQGGLEAYFGDLRDTRVLGQHEHKLVEIINWKEADRTKFTEATTRGFLVVEALPPVDRGLVEQAIHELGALVMAYCGGLITSGMVDAGHAEMELGG